MTNGRCGVIGEWIILARNIFKVAKKRRGLLLISFFLIPFTFLSTYVDFYWRGKEGLIGYICVLVSLFVISLFQNSTKQMLFLNLISCLSSYVFNLVYLQDANNYFKPFSSNMLVIIESMGWVTLQALIVGIKNLNKGD